MLYMTICDVKVKHINVYNDAKNVAAFLFYLVKKSAAAKKNKLIIKFPGFFIFHIYAHAYDR